MPREALHVGLKQLRSKVHKLAFGDAHSEAQLVRLTIVGSHVQAADLSEVAPGADAPTRIDDHEAVSIDATKKYAPSLKLGSQSRCAVIRPTPCHVTLISLMSDSLHSPTAAPTQRVVNVCDPIETRIAADST